MRLQQCSLKDSPLVEWVSNIDWILDDRANNLWIDAGYITYARTVYMKQANSFKIHAPDIPSKVRRSLNLKLDVTDGDNSISDARIFWRLNKGQWKYNESGSSLKIDFKKDGNYQVEVRAMDSLGQLSEFLSFSVEVIVPAPETIFIGPLSETYKDVVWEIPVKITPSEAGLSVSLKFRINHGEWINAYKNKMVAFNKLRRGLYSVEVAACENDKYFDKTPLSFYINYEPDYNEIVQSRLGIIRGENSELVQEALSEIRMAGPDILPVLYQYLEESKNESKLFDILQHLIQELELDQKSN